MSYTIADGQLAESRVADFQSQNKNLSRLTQAHYLADWDREHPSEDGAGFPFSGDFLGTFSHRETTAQGDPGDEARRERTHTAPYINVWDMVSA